MNIDILIHTRDVKQHLKVTQSDYDRVVRITSFVSKGPAKPLLESEKNIPVIVEEKTIEIDETGARQLMLALQKILW